MPLLRWRQQSLLSAPRIAGRQSARACSQVLGVGMVLCHLAGTSGGGAVNPNVLVLASPCRIFPGSHLQPPSLLGGAGYLGWVGGTLGTAPGDTLLGSGSHLPCLPPPGLYTKECLSEALGSSIPVTAVTVPPPGLPHLPLNYPLPHWPEHVWGEGRERMTTLSQGCLPQKGKEKKGVPHHHPTHKPFLIATA